MNEDWDGLLPIDKPAGPTSHDIVARVRAATGSKRVGHTGTLDPTGTGLLLLVLGRATRLARFVPQAPKTYVGAITLGVTTATDDLASDVLRRHEGPLPGADEVLAAAGTLLGRQLQVPPAFSARQVDGIRMYRLARRGVAVAAPATEIFVHRFELTPTDSPDVYGYEVTVSAGTYVRGLARDLGIALGCGAAVAALRRTSIGPLSVAGALAFPGGTSGLREAVRDRLIPIDAMPIDLPSVTLTADADVVRFAAGVVVTIGAAESGEEGLAAVRGPDGNLLGVGRPEGSSLRPRVVLPRDP